MKLLTWQAERFAWRSFSKTLEDQPDQDVDVSVEAAVVVFMQVEAGDQPPEALADEIIMRIERDERS